MKRPFFMRAYFIYLRLNQFIILEFLLELPLSLGLFLFILFISSAGIIVVYLFKKLIGNRMTKQHEKVGRLLFRVIAGLIALLVSLSYANERVQQSKIIDSMEEEAAIIIAVSMRLSQFNSIEAKTAYTKINEYVELTINDNWENIENDPYFSKITQSMIEAHHQILKIPTENESEVLEKKMILSDVNDIIKLSQIRVYSQHTSTPHLIYILFIGLLFMWVFFTVYTLDLVSLLFLTLYNILIAVLIYFVFSLSNPLIGPLKVDPYAFTIVKTKGFDMYSK